MKFKIYAVTKVTDDGKDESILTFYFSDYVDAVNQFKDFVGEAKEIDWVEEGLTEGDRDGYIHEIIDTVDYWCFRRHHMIDKMFVAVVIEEKEVL